MGVVSDVALNPASRRLRQFQKFQSNLQFMRYRRRHPRDSEIQEINERQATYHYYWRGALLKQLDPVQRDRIRRIALNRRVCWMLHKEQSVAPFWEHIKTGHLMGNTYASACRVAFQSGDEAEIQKILSEMHSRSVPICTALLCVLLLMAARAACNSPQPPKGSDGAEYARLWGVMRVIVLSLSASPIKFDGALEPLPRLPPEGSPALVGYYGLADEVKSCSTQSALQVWNSVPLGKVPATRSTMVSEGIARIRRRVTSDAMLVPVVSHKDRCALYNTVIEVLSSLQLYDDIMLWYRAAIAERIYLTDQSFGYLMEAASQFPTSDYLVRIWKLYFFQKDRTPKANMLTSSIVALIRFGEHRFALRLVLHHLTIPGIQFERDTWMYAIVSAVRVGSVHATLSIVSSFLEGRPVRNFGSDVWKPSQSRGDFNLLMLTHVVHVFRYCESPSPVSIIRLVKRYRRFFCRSRLPQELVDTVSWAIYCCGAKLSQNAILEFYHDLAPENVTPDILIRLIYALSLQSQLSPRGITLLQDAFRKLRQFHREKIYPSEGGRKAFEVSSRRLVVSHIATWMGNKSLHDSTVAVLKRMSPPKPQPKPSILKLDAALTAIASRFETEDIDGAIHVLSTIGPSVSLTIGHFNDWCSRYPLSVSPAFREAFFTRVSHAEDIVDTINDKNMEHVVSSPAMYKERYKEFSVPHVMAQQNNTKKTARFIQSLAQRDVLPIAEIKNIIGNEYFSSSPVQETFADRDFALAECAESEEADFHLSGQSAASAAVVFSAPETEDSFVAQPNGKELPKNAPLWNT